MSWVTWESEFRGQALIDDCNDAFPLSRHLPADFLHHSTETQSPSAQTGTVPLFLSLRAHSNCSFSAKRSRQLQNPRLLLSADPQAHSDEENRSQASSNAPTRLLSLQRRSNVELKQTRRQSLPIHSESVPTPSCMPAMYALFSSHLVPTHSCYL